jgi:hypothetical protein
MEELDDEFEYYETEDDFINNKIDDIKYNGNNKYSDK